MFNLCTLDSTFDFIEFLKRIRLGKSKVVFDFVPPGEEHEFLVLAFFIDPPATGVAVGCRVVT